GSGGRRAEWRRGSILEEVAADLDLHALFAVELRLRPPDLQVRLGKERAHRARQHLIRLQAVEGGIEALRQAADTALGALLIRQRRRVQIDGAAGVEAAFDA